MCAYAFYPAVSENVWYTGELTDFCNPTEQHAISRVPRFSHYISSISMNTLHYMNEINLREGGGAFHFRKSDMFPPGVQKAVIFFFSAS